MVYTEWTAENEHILQQPDSVLGNLTALAAVLVLFALIRHILPKKKEALSKAVRVITVLGVIYTLSVSLVWVYLSCVQPYADGWYLCVMADLMEKGLYDVMAPNGYLGRYPQQYGLVFILQMIDHFSGGINHVPFQVLNALHMPLMVFACHRIVWYAFQKKEICVYYWLLMIGYLPIWMYVPYVYGEIISITFCMVLLWQVLRFCREGETNLLHLLCMAAVAGIACRIRLNSLIVVIACCLVLLLYGCCRRSLKALAVIICMIAGILLANAGLKGYYEYISGVRIGKGIPYTAHILMGLQDSEGGPGWYTGLNSQLYEKYGYDTEATAAYCRKAIAQRLQELKQGGAVDFFCRKIESQWNEPDCHAYFETEKGSLAMEEIPGLAKHVYTGTGRDLIRHWMDRCQFVLYAGAAFLAIALLRGTIQRDLSSLLLFVVIIGGFLFSILWEAQSRYVLPYMLVFVMLAGGGIFSLQEWAKKAAEKYSRPSL